MVKDPLSGPRSLKTEEGTALLKTVVHRENIYQPTELQIAKAYVSLRGPTVGIDTIGVEYKDHPKGGNLYIIWEPVLVGEIISSEKMQSLKNAIEEEVDVDVKRVGVEFTPPNAGEHLP